MERTIDILRRRKPDEPPFHQSFLYETADGTETVATTLTNLNDRAELRDTSGQPVGPIRWECSCLQKKCGACAMVISGRPMLACDAKLEAVAKRGKITVAPLKKFPPVADLIVDREPVFKALAEARLWLENSGSVPAENTDIAFETSRCLQCGCCLEVCPNFYAEGPFFGMATVPLTTRLLTELSPADYREIARQYAKHTFAGCGKSLACKDVCPRRIDTEKLLVNANALAVWKRKKEKRK